jgi:hypothetical protein
LYNTRFKSTITILSYCRFLRVTSGCGIQIRYKWGQSNPTILCSHATCFGFSQSHQQALQYYLCIAWWWLFIKTETCCKTCIKSLQSKAVFDCHHTSISRYMPHTDRCNISHFHAFLLIFPTSKEFLNTICRSEK